MQKIEIPKFQAILLSEVINNTDITSLEDAEKLSQSRLWLDSGLDSDKTPMLIYPKYLTNLIMQTPLQESTHILVLTIYLNFTEK